MHYELEERSSGECPAEGGTSTLERWFGGLTLAEFHGQFLQRQPLAMPGGAMDAIAACDWRELGRLLEATESDVLVVAASKLLPSIAPPRSLAELSALFRSGIGVAVRKPAPCGPLLEAVTRAVARDLPGEQRLILFATPKGTNGFGWHYDAEDVFIVQTAGDKEYFFRPNTVEPNPRRGAQPDFSTVRRERSPIMGCRLLPGDVLYLPRGYWHVAHAHADSLSISIGVFPECPNLERGGA